MSSKKESGSKEAEEKPFKVNYYIYIKIAVNSTKKDVLVNSKTNKKFVKYLKNYANVWKKFKY